MPRMHSWVPPDLRLGTTLNPFSFNDSELGIVPYSPAIGRRPELDLTHQVRVDCIVSVPQLLPVEDACRLPFGEDKQVLHGHHTGTF